jgi:signal-transduction protein with cAMP-binding, CBS, and nucleotidyltransferase domain
LQLPVRGPVAKVRINFPAVDDGSFFVTMQDGSLNGIVLPEWFYSVSNDEARDQTMAVVAHPITFVDAVRQQDTVLTAFSLMERLRRDHLPVTDLREKLVGVITREQIAQRLLNGAPMGISKDAHLNAAAAGAGRLAA